MTHVRLNIGLCFQNSLHPLAQACCSRNPITPTKSVAWCCVSHTFQIHETFGVNYSPCLYVVQMRWAMKERHARHMYTHEHTHYIHTYTYTHTCTHVPCMHLCMLACSPHVTQLPGCAWIRSQYVVALT